jgi:hypothetical protein
MNTPQGGGMNQSSAIWFPKLHTPIRTHHLVCGPPLHGQRVGACLHDHHRSLRSCA